MTKILIADNDPKIRSLIGRYFKERGFTVLEAATLEEALETAREAQPAVAILDSDTQSGIDGFTAVKAIKKEVPAVKVILLVATSHSRRHLEARAAGADIVLIKNLTTLTALGVAAINFAGKD